MESEDPQLEAEVKLTTIPTYEWQLREDEKSDSQSDSEMEENDEFDQPICRLCKSSTCIHCSQEISTTEDEKYIEEEKEPIQEICTKIAEEIKSSAQEQKEIEKDLDKQLDQLKGRFKTIADIYGFIEILKAIDEFSIYSFSLKELISDIIIECMNLLKNFTDKSPTQIEGSADSTFSQSTEDEKDSEPELKDVIKDWKDILIQTYAHYVFDIRIRRCISSLTKDRVIDFHKISWDKLRDFDNQLLKKLDEIPSMISTIKLENSVTFARFLRKCTRYLRLFFNICSQMISMKLRAERSLNFLKRQSETYSKQHRQEVISQDKDTEKIMTDVENRNTEYYTEKVVYSTTVLTKLFEESDDRIIDCIIQTITNGLKSLDAHKDIISLIQDIQKLKIDKEDKNSFKKVIDTDFRKFNIDRIFKFLNRKIYKIQEEITSEYNILINFVEAKSKPLNAIINLSKSLNKVYPVLKLTNVEDTTMPSNSFEIKKLISDLFRNMFKFGWFAKISSYKGKVENKKVEQTIIKEFSFNGLISYLMRRWLTSPCKRIIKINKKSFNYFSK